MYSFQILIQQGRKFDAQLFKDKEIIGGIGYDLEGVYMNLRDTLTVKETKELMEYIENITPTFGNYSVKIYYLDFEKESEHE